VCLKRKVLLTIIRCGSYLLTYIPGITLEEMDALFANSCCKAVWAGIRGRPVPGRVDPAENFSIDDEKGKMDVTVEHVERQNPKQEM
jgi:hypothetical protein